MTNWRGWKKCGTGCMTLLLCGLFVLAGGSVWAGGNADLFNPDTGASWQISADEMEFDPAAGVYTAKGNVTISREGRVLKADRVRFAQQDMFVEAAGHVVMTSAKDMVTAERIEMDLNTETGSLYHASIFIEQNHFYIKGETIEKIGEDAYRAHKASLTSCDGDRPAWRITARNMDVTVEGYGFVHHAAFMVRDVPVFYTPFFMFPAKTERQSGLLTPRFGYSGRNGAEIIQPFFWAINDHTDATFYWHYMDKRGHKHGLEYRYVLSQKSQGTAMFDYLNDRQIDDNTTAWSREYGYQEDAVPRPDTERYWFRMKHDQALPSQFNAQIDLDIVSDQDYLDEFDDGYTGYNASRSWFLNRFGRDIDDAAETERLNRLNIYRNFNKYSFRFETRWYDDMIQKQMGGGDDTLQRLPRAVFDVRKQKIGNTPLYWRLESEYNYFYRETGTRGHRGDVIPRLLLPLSWEQYFTLEPSVGLRETAWFTDHQTDEAGEIGKDRYDHREMYDIDTQMSTRVSKVFTTGFDRVDRIRHMVIPKLTYRYVPEKDQDAYPYYDDTDRVEKQNSLTLSMTHTLTARMNKNQEDQKAYEYSQFCRFELAQAYDFNESGEDDPEKRPFLPLAADLTFSPFSYLYIRGDVTWSHDAGRFNTRNLSIALQDTRGDRVSVEHRYTRSESESVYAALTLPLAAGWSAASDYERNLFTDQEIESGISLRYQGRCWSAGTGVVRKAGGDRQWRVMIHLNGLGGIGNP